MVIGSYIGAGVDSFDWWQKLPNLSDYGTVILDTTKIFYFWYVGGRLKPMETGNARKFTPAEGIVPQTALPEPEKYVLTSVNQQDEMIKSNMEIIKRKLVEMMEFNFNVYVLFSPSVEITHEVEWTRSFPGPSVQKKSERFVSTNDWCPISVQTFAESGRTVRLNDESYEAYFKAFTGWKYYFVSQSVIIEELESCYDNKWKVVPHLNAIATNNLDKPIAVEFSLAFHRWAHDEEEGGWESIPKRRGGTLVLLPVADQFHTESAVELLLPRAREFEETPPPNWAGGIEIPGETSIKNEIAEQKKQLEAMASKLSEVEGSLRELQRFKGLLYETGLVLQELVRETLEKLGARTEPSIVSDEFIISIGEEKALVEVKGVGKSMSKGDLGQLITDLGEHLKATGEGIQGVLIGNAWRNLPLDQRDTHDKPIFPKNVVKIAENQNIGLISTTELFKAYCDSLKDPGSKESTLPKIIRGKGIIRF